MTQAVESDPGGAPPDEGRRERRLRLLLGAVLAFVGLRLWVVPLGEGLWLDETGTAFVVRAGADEVVARSLRYQGQSPLYYLLAWASIRLLGWSEVALRLPSLLALGAALGLVWRLAARAWGPEAGLIAAGVLAVGLGPAGADARPYALALALVTGSSLALVRWVERPGPGRGLLWALLAGLTVWAHFLFGAALVAQAAWVLHRRRAAGPAGAPSWPQLLLPAGAALLLLLPCLGQLLWLWGRRASLVLVPRPAPHDLLQALVPSTLAGGLVLGLALAWLLARSRGGLGLEAPRDPAPARLALAWHLTPPGCLFAASWLGDASLFVPRYWLSALPGTALLLAAALGALRPRAAGTVAGLALVVAGLGGAQARMDDWRWELEQVRAAATPGAPVIMPSHLVESLDPALLQDPAWRDWLLAPLAAYPLAPGTEVLLLPRDPEACSPQRLEQVASRVLTASRAVIVRGEWVACRLEARLAPLGWTARRITGPRQGLVTVLEAPPR